MGDATVFRAVLDERETQEECTGDERLRNIHGKREGGVTHYVAVILLSGVGTDCQW